MKTNNILKSRRGQLLVFSALVVLLGGIVVWDFLNHTGQDDDIAEPRLHRVESNKSSVEWVESQNADQPERSVISKVYDGYQRLRPILPLIEEEEPAMQTGILEDDVEGVSMPLIKFEHEVEGREVSQLESAPLLKLPIGVMIYARLLKPIDSRQSISDQPIYASLTRALILNAKTVLPADTRLIGSLQTIRSGHASFGSSWRVVINGEDRYLLNGDLQERDYNPLKGTYGASDGIAGLHMKPLDIFYEPKVHKLERLLEDVVRPLAIRRTQSEILSELELPTVDNPFDLDGFEESEDVSEETYYLSAGTEFYIQIFSQ